MRRAPLLAALALAASTSSCVIVADDDAILIVENLSDYALVELYLTETDDPDWGPNLLPAPLFPGETAEISDIDCDFYDALLIAEDGAECEILDLYLCFNEADWIIRNGDCPVFETAAAAADDESDDESID